MNVVTASDRIEDVVSLSAESDRAAELCLACKLCSSFCPVFVRFFEKMDRPGIESPTSSSGAVLDRAGDLCFFCRRCTEVCPYRPDRDPVHALDLPRLFLRHRILQKQETGIGLADRLLGNADLIGAIGSLTAPFSDWITRRRSIRVLLERIVGIDRDFPFPRFRRGSFDRWFRKREKKLRKRVPGRGGRVVLFTTCSVNYERPEIGKAVVALLTLADVRVVCPEQRCCGRCSLENGDREGTLENLRSNVRMLLRYVVDGYRVVVLQPECSAFWMREAVWIDPSEDTARVAGAIDELGSYLISLMDKGLLRRPRSVDAWTMCEVRTYLSQSSKRAPNDPGLLDRLPGAEVERIEGDLIGGGRPWRLPGEEGRGDSRLTDSLRQRLSANRSLCVVADCVRTGRQIERRLGIQVQHPAEILCEAYGLNPERAGKWGSRNE